MRLRLIDSKRSIIDVNKVIKYIKKNTQLNYIINIYESQNNFVATHYSLNNSLFHRSFSVN